MSLFIKKQIFKCISFFKRVFGNRLMVTRIVFALTFFSVFFALFSVQIMQYDRYREQNVRGRYSRVSIPASRGHIYDREGRPLAISLPSYSLYIDSWQVNDRMKRDDSYREYLTGVLSEILSIDESVLSQRMRHPYPLIKSGLSLEEYIALRQNVLPGVVFDKAYKRIYPNNRMASHILGFTGTEGHGLEGLEFFYNGLLQGRDGVSLVLRDGNGGLIRSVEKPIVAMEKGKDLYLTIDSIIQFIVEDELAEAITVFNAKSASAVVMDYDTGEILAMANMPDYNPNASLSFTPFERRNRLLADFFEPGSTFKIVATSAVIEEELFNVSDKINCEKGNWLVRNRSLRDVKAHEELTVSEILAKSSNIGTVKMALELGEEKLYEYCLKFGFGENTGIDLPGESPGVLRPLRRWSSHSIIAIPIGQEIAVNALQSIRSMCVIANGGYLVKPQIVSYIKDGSRGIETFTNNEKYRVISYDTAAALKSMLADVAHAEGTVPLASIPGYNVYGKTGTAQKFQDGRYSTRNYVASFSGFTDAPDARLAVFVKVDEPRPIYYGSMVAAPVFKNIMHRIMHYRQVAPFEKNEQQLHLVKR